MLQLTVCLQVGITKEHNPYVYKLSLETYISDTINECQLLRDESKSIWGKTSSAALTLQFLTQMAKRVGGGGGGWGTH